MWMNQQANPELGSVWEGVTDFCHIITWLAVTNTPWLPGMWYQRIHLGRGGLSYKCILCMWYMVYTSVIDVVCNISCSCSILIFRCFWWKSAVLSASLCDCGVKEEEECCVFLDSNHGSRGNMNIECEKRRWRIHTLSLLFLDCGDSRLPSRDVVHYKMIYSLMTWTAS